MRQAFAAAAAGLILASQPYPGSADPLNGNQLLELCKQDPATSIDGAICMGFIMGVFATSELYQEAFHSPAMICGSANVTWVQVRDLTLKYLGARPEIRHQDAASLVWMAGEEAFRCPAK